MRNTDWLSRIASGDVPHAILFAGPQESGQLLLARRAAARYLFGTDSTEALADSPFYIEPEDRSIDAIRDALALLPGAKLMVLSDGESILLKPIRRPDVSEFREMMDQTAQWAAEVGMKEEDIDVAIREVRKARHSGT